jgi:hypothetical protein
VVQVTSPHKKLTIVNLTTRLGAQPWQVKVQMFVQKLQWHVLSAKSETTLRVRTAEMIQIAWS